MDVKLAFIGLCAVFPIALSSPKSEINRRIVNGKTIHRGTWPFLVSLHYKKETPFSLKSTMKHACGGTLIHPRWVLTAAHCIEYSKAEYSDPRNWEVVVGEYNQFVEDEEEQVIQAEEFFVHPDYNFLKTHEMRSDIGLIKLKEEAVVGGHYADTIPLDDRKNLRRHSECKIGGWGQAAMEPFSWAMYIPFETTVYTSNIKKCKAKYDLINAIYVLKGKQVLQARIDESWLCAEIPRRNQSTIEKKYGGRSGACKGDSGGPLICKYNKDGDYVVSGIVSVAFGCGSSEIPDGFTKVSYFWNWILDVIESNTQEDEPSLLEMIAELLGIS